MNKKWFIKAIDLRLRKGKPEDMSNKEWKEYHKWAKDKKRELRKEIKEYG